jgi:hypothetical protein
MGGNSTDKERPGRENQGAGAGNSQGGTLGRDQQQPKSNVLYAGGKVQPGTMAYRLAEARQAKAAKAAKELKESQKRIKDYDKKLKFEAIHRNTGMWNHGVRSL